MIGTEANSWGGAIRSSDEITVMVMERRGCVKWLILKFNLKIGGDFDSDKTVYHI